jgi:hypothetical protein
LIKDEIAGEKVVIDLMPVDDSLIKIKIESHDMDKISKPSESVTMKIEAEGVEADVMKSETVAAPSSSSSVEHQNRAASESKHPSEILGANGNASTIKVLPVLSQLTKAVIMPRAPDTLSAIHANRGFLDVGNDALFASTEPWVVATAAILARKKQPGV